MARFTLCFIKLTFIVTGIFPTSVDDFLRTISPAFDLKYLKEFEASCYHFDHISGSFTSPCSTSSSTSRHDPAPNLSDSFICCLDFDSWITDICQAIALYCFKTITPGRKHTHRAIPQYDGPSDMEPLSQVGVVDDGGPFKQVTLVGPNLFEAWNRLSFTRNLENMSRRSSTWTPSQPGGLYVYHGTAAHIELPGFILALADRPFNGLRGMSQRNQITPALGPGGINMPVVWTAFSPLRAFLWAVFRGEVVSNISGPTTQSKSTSPGIMEIKLMKASLFSNFPRPNQAHLVVAHTPFLFAKRNSGQILQQLLIMLYRLLNRLRISGNGLQLSTDREKNRSGQT
jgi:hypothetical protein